jgi:hypothetical protein
MKKTLSGVWHRVAPVKTDVSEKCTASIIIVTRIGEIGITLAVTSNRRKLHRNTMWETLHSSKHRFLKEPYGVTSQNTVFFSDQVFWIRKVLFLTGLKRLGIPSARDATKRSRGEVLTQTTVKNKGYINLTTGTDRHNNIVTSWFLFAVLTA